MRIRNTIIALVVLALVGGYAYLISKRETISQTVKLFKIKPEDITRIDLKYPDRELELGRDQAGKWEIESPIHTDADQTVANNLARAIADCEVKKTVEEKPNDLKPFGLDKPETTVTITAKGKGVLPAILVGKTTPIGFSAYIKTADKPAVLLTNSAFPPGMNKKLDDLRDRELMSFKVDDVQKLMIDRDNGPEIEVDRTGDKWNIVKPANYPADPTQVRQVLSALDNARVADFISDAPASVTQYGLQHPHLQVTVLAGKQNARQSLLFGFKQTEQGKDGIYVRRGERAPVYTVHPYVMTDADKSVLELRDKTVQPGFANANVDGMTFISGGSKFALKRLGTDKWQVTDGGSADADAGAVERFLDSLRFLKGSAIVEDPLKTPAKYGLDKPAEEIQIIGKDNKDLGSLKLAKVTPEPARNAPPDQKKEPEYYVTSSAGTAVYAIDDYTFDQMNKTADQFKAHAAATPAASPKAAAK